METSAFDVLGSVLLGYLESVGEAVATNVEESGRSSAHVNAYDVLNAVEGCTAVAATQLRFSSSGGGGGAQQQQPLPGSAVLPTQQQLQQPLPQLDQGQMIEQATSGRGWEGLASFLFGSNWYSIPLEGEDTPKEDKDDKSSSTTATTPTIMNGTTINGGKGGPSTSTGKILPTDKTTITTPTSATSKPVGGSKSGKGKQLANMTPPPGVSVVGNEVIMGNTTTGSGTNEKNVSFSLLERKNSKGDSSSILLHGTTDAGTKNNNNGPSSSSTSGRWDAPYLNEVAPFPLVTRTEDIANPHCLSGTNIALSMHDLATEQEACRDTSNSASSLSNKKQRRGSSANTTASSGTGAAGSSSIKDWRKDIADLKLKIPKDVFATKDIIWGSMKQDDDSNKDKKKKKDDNGNTHKTTTEDTSLMGTGGGPLPKLPAVKMPSYVPNFFPPFPRTEESISSLLPSVPTTAVMSDVMSRVSQKRKSPFSSSGSGSNNNETVAAERNTVRHSLVELGKNAVGPSYWGSNWLNNNDDDDDDDVTRKSTEKLKINNTAGQLTVTPGPSSSASSGRPSDNNTNNKKAGGGGADAQVVPLARASGSRVAKILEGSN